MHLIRRIFIVGVTAFAICGITANQVQAQRLGGRSMRRVEPKEKKDKVDFSDRTITFPATDGVQIVADWYPAKVKEGEQSPVAILIHMYPATRSSWKPMVPLLRDQLGISVLAYDIRGTGESLKPEELQLARKYQDRDPQLFADAVKDTVGAYNWLAEQPNITLDRLVVFGASVGCSISLQFAAQQSQVKGVACLSPGTNYMGIDSIGSMKALQDSDTKVLLMAPAGEYKAVEELMAAVDNAKFVKGKKWPGGRENHATRMFDTNYGDKVKERLQRFARGVLKIDKKLPGHSGKKKGEEKDASDNDA